MNVFVENEKQIKKLRKRVEKDRYKGIWIPIVCSCIFLGLAILIEAIAPRGLQGMFYGEDQYEKVAIAICVAMIASVLIVIAWYSWVKCTLKRTKKIVERKLEQIPTQFNDLEGLRIQEFQNRFIAKLQNKIINADIPHKVYTGEEIDYDFNQQFFKEIGNEIFSDLKSFDEQLKIQQAKLDWNQQLYQAFLGI